MPQHEITYQEKITSVFNNLVKRNGSASAGEVTEELRKLGWLSPMDTVIDIHKLMKEYFGEPNANKTK